MKSNVGNLKAFAALMEIVEESDFFLCRYRRPQRMSKCVAARSGKA